MIKIGIMWTLVILGLLASARGAISPSSNPGCKTPTPENKCLECLPSFILLPEFSICISLQLAQILDSQIKNAQKAQGSNSAFSALLSSAGNGQPSPADGNKKLTENTSKNGNNGNQSPLSSLSYQSEDGIIPGCAQHGNGVCLKCAYRFYSSYGACKAVSDQCKTWGEGTGACTSCYDGYEIMYNDCALKKDQAAGTVVIPGCLKYVYPNGDGIGGCEKCAFRYVGIAGRCKAVSDQCRTWSQSSGACTACYVGFELVSNDCVLQKQPTPALTGCAQQANGVCVKCAYRYYNASGICKVVSSVCQTWNQRGGCTSCYLGYKLQGSDCIIGGQTNTPIPTPPPSSSPTQITIPIGSPIASISTNLPPVISLTDLIPNSSPTSTQPAVTVPILPAGSGQGGASSGASQLPMMPNSNFKLIQLDPSSSSSSSSQSLSGSASTSSSGDAFSSSSPQFSIEKWLAALSLPNLASNTPSPTTTPNP